MPLRLIRQIDGSRFDSSNCGCVATAHAIAWSTRGKVRRTPDECRKALKGAWIGQKANPPNDATSLSDQKRAWATFAADAKRADLKLPEFSVNLLRPWKEVTNALDAGNAVMLQIDHETINKRVPLLSGFPTFNGLHVVLLTDTRQRGGQLEMLDFDGGFDGRFREGRRVPRGPQWLPEDVLKVAAQRKNVRSLMASGTAEDEAKKLAKGTATFAVIPRAQPIEAKPKDKDKEPIPGPGPTVKQLRADLAAAQAALAQANATNDSLTDENIALENALGEARTVLIAASQANLDLDAAVADIDAVLAPPVDPGDAVTDGVGPEE